jgi:predicted RNA-binding Zn-ribbon protein involved in translation (DUF1610 family)
MTTIKATCPSCGEVGLTPEDIDLRVDRSGGSESSYAFTCPACLEVVRKPADERVVRLLLSGGVQATVVPAEPFGPRPTGPRFTHDDMLDFHAMLQRDDWFFEVESLVRDRRRAA